MSMSIPSTVLRKKLSTSTMDDAAKAVHAGYGHGTVCMALKQSFGRGRLPGRQWVDGNQSLLFTLILDQKTHYETYPFTQVMALALCRHLEKAHGLRPQIKWPNDVLLEGHKTAGILVESLGGFYLAGMGLNLVFEGGGNDFKLPATGLSDHIGRYPDTDEELAGILEELNQLINKPGRIEDLTSRLAFMNQVVKVRLGDPSRNETQQGKILGLNRDGSLLLNTDRSRLFSVYSGEIDFSC